MVGVKLYNRLFYTNPKPKFVCAFFYLFFFFLDADGVVWLVCFTDVTHRSSSSFGSFLLMTASSLFVNIWKVKERTFYWTQPGNPQLPTFLPSNTDAITQLKDGRCIKERINDSNLASWDRNSVTPWETVRMSGDKGSARGHVFCLLSQKSAADFEQTTTIVIYGAFVLFAL